MDKRRHEAIQRVNGYDENAYTYYPVLIVGAGESGIAMGCRLKQALGFDQFRIFDRQAGVGGTWWINRYPGVACDVPAVFYSFSFAPNPAWTSFFPPGDEIVQYLHDVCRKFEITDKIQLNTDVTECRWLEEEKLYEVRLRYMIAGMGDLPTKEKYSVIAERGETAVYTSEETVRAKIVISCVGGLVEPKGFPDIQGQENFKGKIFHSARWDHKVDFTDKNIIVVGSGCSAAQFVPRLTQPPYNAKSVTQIMRTPPWVVPRMDPPGGLKWWQENSAKLFVRFPILLKMLRFSIAAGAEYDFRLFKDTPFGAKERKKYEEVLLRHLKKTLPEKYHDIFTPDYGVGCKRRIFDAYWFPGLRDGKIEVTTQPLTKINDDSVVVGPGRMYPDMSKTDSLAPTEERTLAADIIVLANGYETTQWLHPLKVTGVGGHDLVETMHARGGAQAYQGTAMDGFPNFFMIFGPNTATGHSSVIMASENMVEFSLKFVRRILEGDVAVVDVKHEAEVAFTTELQRQLQKTVFQAGGCNSWYFDQKNGWNSTVYPRTQIDFAYRCLFPKWRDWNITLTEQGIRRQRYRRITRLLGALLLALAIRRTRQNGFQFMETVAMAKGYLRTMLAAGQRALA